MNDVITLSDEEIDEFLHGKWDMQEIMECQDPETGAPPYAATPARSGQ